MKRVLTIFAVISGLASTPSVAQTFLLTGSLDDGDAPASGLLTFALEIHDTVGVSLWQETQSNVVVVGGVFALDVGAAEPLPPAIPASSTLTITVEDDELEALPLAKLLRVARSARTPVADESPSARRVGGVVADDVVTREALSTPGGASVPVSGVADMPADVLDGDNGAVVVAAGDNVTLSPDGTLALASSIPGSALANNSVNQFGTGVIQSAKVAVGAVTGAKVAANTLTRSDLSSDITASKVSGISVFRVGTNSCSEPSGTLMTVSSCAALVCDTGQTLPNGVPLFGRLSCNDSTNCSTFGASTCANTNVGKLVAP